MKGVFLILSILCIDTLNSKSYKINLKHSEFIIIIKEMPRFLISKALLLMRQLQNLNSPVFNLNSQHFNYRNLPVLKCVKKYPYSYYYHESFHHRLCLV